MKVSITYDLDNEQDRKSYLAATKMRDIVLNLATLKEKIESICMLSEFKSDSRALLVYEMKEYFDEMIHKKLD